MICVPKKKIYSFSAILLGRSSQMCEDTKTPPWISPRWRFCNGIRVSPSRQSRRRKSRCSPNTCLVEYPHQNPNSVPTRSRQVKLSASHVDSCRSRPAYHRTHTRRLQMYQSGVSETHGLLDRHDGTAQTMPSSVRGSALAFAIAGARRFFYMRSCTWLNRSSGMIAGTPPLITTS